LAKAPKRDPAWVQAKKLCRLNQEDIRLAKELGLKPRTLIKNIPSKSQQWKAPVKLWIRDLYEKKMRARRPSPARSLTLLVCQTKDFNSARHGIHGHVSCPKNRPSFSRKTAGPAFSRTLPNGLRTIIQMRATCQARETLKAIVALGYRTEKVD
jgi:hypothetical protein